MAGTSVLLPESPRKEVERMESAEDIRWKLALCAGCGQRRMMLADSASCPECERAGRTTTLSAEDIRWIVSYRGPEGFVKGAWMLATPSTNAAMGLNTKTGMVTVHRWGAGEKMPETDGEIILAVCPAHRRAELPGLLMAGSEGMLSEEDAEALALEVVVRAAMGDGGERFWKGVDEQLRERARR